MNCSPFDLRDYFFGELSPADRSATETHLTACLACREELAKLSEVRAVLMSVPDEEPPQRIGFVSDKVFEPRWWQRLWNSGPQLGFAAAAMLAAALIFHSVITYRAVKTTPLASINTAPLTAPLATPAANVSEDEMQRRVQFEVAKALADRESQQMQKVLEVVNARLRRSESRNNENLILIREYLERMDKRNAATVRRTMYE